MIEGKKLFKEFNNSFLEYCYQEKFASEFTNLHPLLENFRLIIDSGSINMVKKKEVIYIDLTITEEELWRIFSRGNKSNINKARRNGVRIEKVTPDFNNFVIFKQLYYKTMERNLAQERWFFPEDYFTNCFEMLGPERISIFFAYVGEKPISAYLLMHDFKTVYYHFGGSDDSFYKLRPNNLLMFEVAIWAKRQGFCRYHLGGGVSASSEDSLFRFKSGFSDKKAPLYSYYRILHSKTYEFLCELKKTYEIKTTGEISNSDYFPLYRR